MRTTADAGGPCRRILGGKAATYARSRGWNCRTRGDHRHQHRRRWVDRVGHDGANVREPDCRLADARKRVKFEETTEVGRTVLTSAIRRRRSRRRQAGFTLVEILVVITIIGLIMALVGPRVLGY